MIITAKADRLADRGAGVALRTTGSDFTGCWPFHKDGMPSLVISLERNLWHCQADGSVIGWCSTVRTLASPVDWARGRGRAARCHAVRGAAARRRRASRGHGASQAAQHAVAVGLRGATRLL